jgi:serralysin
VDGDGKADIITGAGPGGGSHVKVFSGATGAVLRAFFAYDATFTGGVTVAAGDLDGDHKADIVTGAGPGGGPLVRAFSGATGAVLASFSAYDPNFHGGVWVAAADLDGDGKADIVTGAGPGGGPHVRLWALPGPTQRRGLFAFDPAFAGGVFVG